MEVRLFPLYSDAQTYDSDKRTINDLIGEFRNTTGSRFSVRVFLEDRLILPDAEETHKEIPDGTVVSLIEDMSINRAAWA